AVVAGEDAGTYHTHPAEGLHALDSRDTAAVQGLVAQTQPEVVIQHAAQPHVDWCEDHVAESHAVNVAGTRNVAAAARAVGARYVYCSTDYAFNVAACPYREDDRPDPPNVYGRHQ